MGFRNASSGVIALTDTTEIAARQADLRKAAYPDGIVFEAVAACRMCGASLSGAAVLFEAVPDLDVEGEPSFTILSCSKCATASTTPIPNASTISMLYTEIDSSDYEYPEKGVVGCLKDMFAQRRVRTIVGSLSSRPTSILDFGTGGGRFAAAAATVIPSCKVIGTDFAMRPPARSYYTRRSDIAYLPYDELAAENPRFDLIVARHVIEHVHDPVALLRTLLNMLSGTGSLYVEVPNLTSRTARLLGSRWPLLYVPRHLSHFTSSTLRGAIRRAGGDARIGRCEMPMMGNVLALRAGRSRFDPLFRPLALILHPVQLLLETAANQGTCLYAIVRRSENHDRQSAIRRVTVDATRVAVEPGSKCECRSAVW